MRAFLLSLMLIFGADLAAAATIRVRAEGTGFDARNREGNIPGLGALTATASDEDGTTTATADSNARRLSISGTFAPGSDGPTYGSEGWASFFFRFTVDRPTTVTLSADVRGGSRTPTGASLAYVQIEQGGRQRESRHDGQSAYETSFSLARDVEAGRVYTGRFLARAGIGSTGPSATHFLDVAFDYAAGPGATLTIERVSPPNPVPLPASALLLAAALGGLGLARGRRLL